MTATTSQALHQGDTVRSRREEYAEATHDALVESASACFFESGFAATSLDHVAQRARVTKGAIYHHFSSKRQLFLAVLEREGLAPAKTHDLARNKPALTSSTCQWSRAPGPQCDARGAVTFSLAEDFGFHTDEEMQPWWMVDLGGEAVIDEIRITNRAALGERFVTFIAETSLTGATWTMRHAKLTPEAVSSDPDQPYKIVFPEPLVARYVRLKLLGWGILHLRRVQVLGRELPPRPDYS